MSDHASERATREFLAEASEIVEAMASGLSMIDDQRRKGRVNPAELNAVFRAAHSLKGLAGMFGFSPVSGLAHEMESILDGLRLGKLDLDDALMRVLYRCPDAFAQALARLQDGAALDEKGLAALREDVAALATRPPPSKDESDTILTLSKEALSVLTEYEEHRLADNLRARVPIYKLHAPLALETFESELAALTELISQHGEVITTLPSADSEGTGINFDIVFASATSGEELGTGFGKLGAGRYLLDRVDKQAQRPPKSSVAAELELEPQESTDLTPAPGPVPLGPVTDTVRVDIKKLDELMGIVGELVLARGGLGRVSDELKGEVGYRGIAVDLHRLVRMLERRIADLQSAIMQVRMVPLGQVFDRLARVVRRTAGDLGKQIEFTVSGEDTELDKLIVEELVDPLMHLVRNAVDHGVEDPEIRMSAGKPPTGLLSIKAFPRGNHVIIELSDDGSGIDEVAVKRTALERGLVDEERVGALSQREVWNLLFQPGFSTRKAVSETSGRGVGLDVVKHNISKLSGIIDIESESGRGTRFIITLPITLAIIQALIVHAGHHVFALPLASVLEIVLLTSQHLCHIEGREMVRIRGETIPLLRLNDVFNLDAGPDGDGNEEREGLGFVAVVGLAQHRVALFVDDVTGQQDIVIKSLGAYLSSVKGFAGATQLGDHETILVLDVAALVQEIVAPAGSDRQSAAQGAL